MTVACWSAGEWGTATFPALMFQAEARAVLRAMTVPALMEIGAHDMGQGAWTALAQIAADGLGLDLEHLEFKSGTSDLPDCRHSRWFGAYRHCRHGDP